MSIEIVRYLTLPKILDERGNLSFLQNREQIPFDIERVYWIYDVPGGEQRGGHAFKNQEEVIVAMSGSFDVILNDGKGQQVYHLNRSYYGLYVPKMFWRHIENFSTNSVALVITNTLYMEEDYIRNYNDFIKLKNATL